MEEFIKEAKFDWLGVFNYSDEEGSGAFSLDGKLPKRTIEARKRRLMKLQQSISKRAKQQWVGRELVVLAEGESEETPLLWEGRTQFHAPEIDGKLYINDFGDLEPSSPAASTAPRSPKPTTTTWWRASSAARCKVEIENTALPREKIRKAPPLPHLRHVGPPQRRRLSLSAATAAARSISASGPWASTRSARRSSIPKSSKTWAD